MWQVRLGDPNVSWRTGQRPDKSKQGFGSPVVSLRTERASALLNCYCVLVRPHPPSIQQGRSDEDEEEQRRAAAEAKCCRGRREERASLRERRPGR